MNVNWLVVRYLTEIDVTPQVLQVESEHATYTEAKEAAKVWWRKGKRGVYVRHASRGREP